VTTFYGSSNVKPKTEKPPTIRGVHVKDITARGATQAIDIIGLPELPVSDITFERVTIDSEHGVRCIDCQNVRFSETKIRPRIGLPFQLDAARELWFDHTCTGPADACFERFGRPSSMLHIDGKLVPERALPLHLQPKAP